MDLNSKSLHNMNLRLAFHWSFTTQASEGYVLAFNGGQPVEGLWVWM